MNEVILILSRKNNCLWVTVEGCFTVSIENVTGLYKSVTSEGTYAILSKGEYKGLVHDVAYVAEHW